MFLFFFVKQKTAYEMRISDWSSDVCSSDVFGAWSFGEQVEAARCQKHLRSNPCAALGCKHTRIAKGRLNETSFLCRDHWREVCPPHSRIRKSWRRFFRLAKKMGLKPTDRKWEEHTSELQSLMRNSYTAFCLKKKKTNTNVKRPNN